MVDLGNPDTRIETQEQAIKRVEQLCNRVVECRNTCDVYVPDNPTATAKIQQKAYEQWLMTYGQAIGTLIAYYQCGKIQDNAYKTLKAKVQATLASRVVGNVSGVIKPSGVLPLVNQIPGQNP